MPSSFRFLSASSPGNAGGSGTTLTSPAFVRDENGSSPFSACGHFLEMPVYAGTSMGNVVATALSAVTQTALLLILWYRRRQLSRDGRCCGAATSANASLVTHLLPVHILLLRASVVIYLVQAATLLIPHLGEAATAGVDSRDEGNYVLPCIVKGLVWGAQHVIVDGIGILLVQPGIGRRALRRVLMWALPWGILTTTLVTMSCYLRLDSTNDSEGGAAERWILAGYYALHALAYFVVGFTSCIWWAPCRQKRPAFRTYALGWIVLRTMAICEDLISYVDDDAATCLNFCTVRASFIVFVPLLIYTVFRDDTAFWYGMAYTYSAEQLDPQLLSTKKKEGREMGVGTANNPVDKAGLSAGYGSARPSEFDHGSEGSKSHTFGSKISTFFEKSSRKISYSYTANQGGNDIRRPLMGLQLPDSAIETLSKGIETLDRKAVISFAELSLDVASMMPVLLGAGGTAKVYKGTWRRRVPVAFKLIFAPDINRETIEAFFKEAAILRSLEHPNIVRLMGVCVAPPSLAHVLELCDGSLFDVIQQRKKVGLQRMRKNSVTGGSTGGGTMNKEHLDWFYDVSRQCAAAVAFLHSRTPMAVLHRDIKSLNFLTVGGRVKLADMDLAMFWTKDSSTEGDSSEPTSSEPASSEGGKFMAGSETDSERKYSFASGADLGSGASVGSSAGDRLRQASSTVHSVDLRGSYSGGLLLGSAHGSNARRTQSTHFHFRKRLTKKSWRKSSKRSQRRGDEAALLFDIVGTPQWAAPEVLRRLPGSSRKEADVFALAVVWWECLSLSSPFTNVSTAEVVRLVVGGERLVLPRETPPHLAALLRQCWSEEPADRPSAEEMWSIMGSFKEKEGGGAEKQGAR